MRFRLVILAVSVPIFSVIASCSTTSPSEDVLDEVQTGYTLDSK